MEEIKLGETRHALHDTDADLLDGFAKAALTGMLAFGASNMHKDSVRRVVAEEAYSMADEMMSERVRRRKNNGGNE
jgi:hypothetical protein